MFTFKWQSLETALGIMTPACLEQIGCHRYTEEPKNLQIKDTGLSGWVNHSPFPISWDWFILAKIVVIIVTKMTKAL